MTDFDDRIFEILDAANCSLDSPFTDEEIVERCARFRPGFDVSAPDVARARASWAEKTKDSKTRWRVKL